MAPPSGKSPRKPLKLLPGGRYPGVGYCIYCGESDTPLSNEHVIPLALGANDVLLNASCKRCSDITSLIERKICNESLGDFRNALNMPTRRPNNRSDSIDINREVGEERTTTTVPWDRYPAILGLPRFRQPGMLMGGQEDPRSTRLNVWMGTAGNNQSLPGQVCTTIELETFIRFIAKIAQAATFCYLGSEEPSTYLQFLPKIIDKTEFEFIYHYVGGDLDMDLRPIEQGKLFRHLIRFCKRIEGGWEALIVEIQLFSGAGAPVYTAVFGVRRTSRRTPEPVQFRSPSTAS